MSGFPRTTVGGLSLSRMIIGTNWFLGWSHTGPSQDEHIHTHFPDHHAIANILKVYLAAGVDTIMGPIATGDPKFAAGIAEAEQLTGRAIIRVDTPGFNMGPTQADHDECERLMDRCVELGVAVCMPHHSSVEKLVDRAAGRINRLGEYTKMIRDRGMIPGLSAHMPEIVMFCDGQDEDVETYIQIYNSAGFLMQLEVEFIHKMIRNAKHPVMTIKPMAAGRLTPLVGLNFVWNTLRDCDMVTVGTTTAREAEEVIEYSLAALERRTPDIEGRASLSQGTILDKD